MTGVTPGQAPEPRACDVDIWDGPYRMNCGLTLIDGKCITHGDSTMRRWRAAQQPAPELAGVTPGQAAYEAYVMAAPDDIDFPVPDSLLDWERVSWEAAAQAGYEQRAQNDAAQQPQPAPGEVELALAAIAADRNQLRIALSRIAMGTAGDPSVAADKALMASRENARREPALGAQQPQPVPEPPMLTLYREALERLADEDTPVLAEGIGGGAQEELHVRASFAAHTLGRDTCGCNDCLASLDPDGDQ